MLRAEVYAHAISASQNRRKAGADECGGAPGAAGRRGLRHLAAQRKGDRQMGARVLENLRAGCARYSDGRRQANGRGERDSAVTKAPRRSEVYGMKKSDGAEQPTTGHLKRAGLGRITLWKSYALIRQKKQ